MASFAPTLLFLRVVLCILHNLITSILVIIIYGAVIARDTTSAVSRSIDVLSELESSVDCFLVGGGEIRALCLHAVDQRLLVGDLLLGNAGKDTHPCQ